ncbi:SCO family protein [Oceanihabitans sediminis]|uniref:SCO family protein n=1 Tax=Oceanihabitans sediminis TaxID=1812012 RepID=UPI0009FB6289|nr:SCO family protein [Oceanihabitans sediminis]MDX1278254.1 SCO family protein [Oceanihabitans sediminis]
MKYLKPILMVLLMVVSISSCNNKKSDAALAIYQCPMLCEGDKTYIEEGSCPVCKMDLKLVEEQASEKVTSNEISEESIFNLTSKWHTEEGTKIELKDLKGKTLVMVMIYTSCKAACPRLVADMRNIEAKIPKERLKDLNFILVSIDPEVDTPERLKAFAIENLMDDAHWTFLQGTESGVREFANVLSVKYKEISPIDFSHSNIISVFNTEGELIHQQEGLGVDNAETVDAILELTK